MENRSEYFADIAWCDEDIESALEMEEKEVTEENVAKIRKALDNHFFTDWLIEQGWNYIYDVINSEIKEEN